jgi:hypothetical protein
LVTIRSSRWRCSGKKHSETVALTLKGLRYTQASIDFLSSPEARAMGSEVSLEPEGTAPATSGVRSSRTEPSGDCDIITLAVDRRAKSNKKQNPKSAFKPHPVNHKFSFNQNYSTTRKFKTLTSGPLRRATR